MNYVINDIIRITGGNLLHCFDSQTTVSHLLTDSRKLLFPADTLFLALPGPLRTGNSFVAELYEKGVRNFIVDPSFDNKIISELPQSNIISVKDVLMALQQLAAFHRKNFELPVIGITGSNGKTIIKEWLYQLLGDKFNIVRSPRSYNSQSGVPLSVWQINSQHNLGIFEAGISQPAEMQRLQNIIQPQIGVLGFMGEAHAEGFSSFTEKINEKLKLFVTAQTLVYAEDDERVHRAVLQFRDNVNPQLKLFGWSREHAAALQVGKVERMPEQTLVHCQYNTDPFVFAIPFTDDASVYNAITCCAVLLCLNVSVVSIPVLMNDLKALSMRLELKQGINQCVIINDSYSADMSSLGIALDFLQQQQQHSRRTLILSDLLQSGVPEDKLYAQIATAIAQKRIDRFIGIGPSMMMHAGKFGTLKQTFFYPGTDEFLQHWHDLHFNNETILLKGARVFKFEKIVRALEQKVHETILEINLNALRANLKTYRQLLQPGVKLMAMVKAFGYGSGSHEIAGLLQHEGVEYLAVAYADEGVALRKSGIRLPIMVMNTTAAAFDNIISFSLEPELYSFEILESFDYYLRQKNISQYPVHLKLDTGMHRLGFTEGDMNRLQERLQLSRAFVVKTVFSHLAASESADHDAFTNQQNKAFLKMSDQLQQVLGYTFTRHLANTSAIRRHPHLQYEMVRLGIGLYGVDNSLVLQNVTTLKTTISQIKQLQAGDTVGYGRKGVIDKPSTIATVRIGYADGYPRSLGNGAGYMLVNGQAAPVIGSVCMDMTMLNITGIAADEGDEVIVFGEELPVTAVSKWAKTIPYEILTNIQQRVKRVYFEE